MCTVLLPPGGYPIAVKYISYNNIILKILILDIVLPMPPYHWLRHHRRAHKKNHIYIYSFSQALGDSL